MLLSFRVRNHFSIRDSAELTLYRTRPYADLDQFHEWDPKVSPVAAIYGANASGKSTIFSALSFLIDSALDSFRKWESDDPVPRTPFLLDAESKREPTEIEIEFRGPDGHDYQYGFTTTGESFESEWLYIYKTSHRTVVFERGLNGEVLKFGGGFGGSKSELRTTLAQRPNALVLSVGAQLANQSLLTPWRWITRSLQVYSARGYPVEHARVIDRLTDDSDYKRRLEWVLSKADLGVSGIDVVDEEVDEEEFLRVAEAFTAFNGGDSNVDLDALRRIQSRAIALSHGTEENAIRLPWEWESDGTQALVSFASIAIDAIRDGGLLVVDEIDTSLHPILVRELVSLFQDPNSNPHQAQLVFTTHDATLLSPVLRGKSVLSRDQVWVVEKDGHGASTLTPLSDYKPRKEENLERGYLTGRFGGIPSTLLFGALAADWIAESSVEKATTP